MEYQQLSFFENPIMDQEDPEIILVYKQVTELHKQLKKLYQEATNKLHHNFLYENSSSEMQHFKTYLCSTMLPFLNEIIVLYETKKEVFKKPSLMKELFVFLRDWTNYYQQFGISNETVLQAQKLLFLELHSKSKLITNLSISTPIKFPYIVTQGSPLYHSLKDKDTITANLLPEVLSFLYHIITQLDLKKENYTFAEQQLIYYIGSRFLTEIVYPLDLALNEENPYIMKLEEILSVLFTIEKDTTSLVFYQPTIQKHFQQRMIHETLEIYENQKAFQK